MVEELPCFGKHGSRIQMNGAEPAGGSARGAAAWLPHGVVVIAVSAGSCAAGSATACARADAGQQATITRPRTASQGPPRTCCLPIKPHELPQLSNQRVY